MAVQLRLIFGAACVIAPLLSFAAASAQGKRSWVDPPAEVGTKVRPAPVAADPGPRPAAAPEEPVDKPAVAATGSISTAPVSVPQPAIAPVPAKVKAASRPRGSTARALPTASAREARSTRPSETRRTRVAAPQGAERSARDRRASVASRPLELMSLQTIELPDGRRLNVLTRPDSEMVEDFVSRR